MCGVGNESLGHALADLARIRAGGPVAEILVLRERSRAA